jgi:hypothetical protein
MVAFSGFYESHKPPPSGDPHGVVPLHHDDHQKDNKVGPCFIIVEVIVTLVAAWAIRNE